LKRRVILAATLLLGIAAVWFFGEDPLAIPATITEESAVQPDVIDSSEPAADPLIITFMQESGFYSEAFDAQLFCSDAEADIYFTLDGAVPSVNSTKYTGAIPIEPKTRVTAATIKAVAVKDGVTSDVFTQSYVIGKNVSTRFSEQTLVFVLSADPYDLYDYYNGIATPGFLRDQYISEHGRVPDPTAPANYNLNGRDAERAFYIEVFDSFGTPLISQAAGGRVVGGWSREQLQKSWQLYARKSYGGPGKFKYAFFGRELSSEGRVIAEYDGIRLRNNANDREEAAVRDELTQELARQAGFPDTQLARPAAVFLNGEYYGFSWLKESFGEGYLEAKYGGLKENYQIISDDEGDMEGEEFAVADYARVYELAENGLTDVAAFNEFCKLVDVDNLLMYYAVEIYIDNKDWPNNNMRIWRYYPQPEEVVTNPFNDGKWRFMLFDAEFAWSLYGNSYKDDTLGNVLSGRNHMGGKSALLSALLERPDMRERFAAVMCDLISGAFSPDNALKTLDELVEVGEGELTYALNNPCKADGVVFKYSEWANEDTFENNRNRIRQFAQKRPEVMYGSIRANFGYGDLFSVSATGADGAKTFVNTRRLDGAETAVGKYFTDCAVELRAEAYLGYAVDYWEVNGAKRYGESITLSFSDAVNGGIGVKLVTKKLLDGLQVYISTVKPGDDGCIELFNPNSTAINTVGLYLSDDADNLMRWTVPNMTIPPQSGLVVVCKNNNSEDALKKARTNFNLKAGETLYLSDADGKTVGYVDITDFKTGDIFRRKTDGSYANSSP